MGKNLDRNQTYPLYSTMAPVPPLTVRISATLRIMSVELSVELSASGLEPVRHTLGSSPARHLASKLNIDDLRCFELPGH